MRQKIFRSVAKFFAWVLGLVILILVITPPILYLYTISNLVDELPQKEVNQMEDITVHKTWKLIEECNPDVCASITPYWIYRWFAVALINDLITPVELSYAYSNVSKMAGSIAIYWMRSGHFKGKGKGMGWWHLTHVFLSIQIQRNWSPNEITSKYNAINAKPGKSS